MINICLLSGAFWGFEKKFCTISPPLIIHQNWQRISGYRQNTEKELVDTGIFVVLNLVGMPFGAIFVNKIVDNGR